MQLPLFPSPVQHEFRRTEHGGSLARGRRKTERPVSTRKPMHIVLSSSRARGAWDLRRHRAAVQTALRAAARRNGIRVYEFANVGSHLHMLLRARRREAFQAFLRGFAGLVARRVTGAKKGSPRGRFWSCVAWSRMVAWGRDYVGVRHYIVRNEIEGAEGALVRAALSPPKAGSPLIHPHAHRVPPHRRSQSPRRSRSTRPPR
jgi:hypothetical protein